MPTVTRVTATDDLLTVEGTDDDGNELTATGWVSAMQNFYPPECYGDDGHLLDGAKPKAMTKAQQKAYWQALLAAAAPTPPAEPVVLFGS